MFVQVIDHADEKPIKEIAKDVRELGQKVRTVKLKSENMQKGTFTINRC